MKERNEILKITHRVFHVDQTSLVCDCAGRTSSRVFVTFDLHVMSYDRFCSFFYSSKDLEAIRQEVQRQQTENNRLVAMATTKASQTATTASAPVASQSQSMQEVEAALD